MQAIKYDVEDDSALGRFLVERAVGSRTLGNMLYWYISVETRDTKYGQRYVKLLDSYLKQLNKVWY